MSLSVVGWVLVGALFATGALAMALGLWPLMLPFVAMGWLSPALGPLLGVAFDRWASGQITRLLTLAFLLAAAASLLLLALPVQTESIQASSTISVRGGQRSEERRGGERTSEVHWPGLVQTQGPRIIGVLAIPVAVGGMPLMAHLVTRRWRGLSTSITVGLAGAATVLLVAFVLIGSVSLFGFFYLPSAAAMGAAVVRGMRARRTFPANG